MSRRIIDDKVLKLVNSSSDITLGQVLRDNPGNVKDSITVSLNEEMFAMPKTPKDIITNMINSVNMIYNKDIRQGKEWFVTFETKEGNIKHTLPWDCYVILYSCAILAADRKLPYNIFIAEALYNAWLKPEDFKTKSAGAKLFHEAITGLLLKEGFNYDNCSRVLSEVH